MAQETVELQAQARFGKRDAGSEYSWLVGRERVPPELLEACEPLARVTTAAGVYASLVVETRGETWLARAYREGVDSAYRSIAALELVTLVNPRRLPPDRRLGLAVFSIRPEERQRIGETSLYTVSVPEAQSDAVEIDVPTLWRARLGYPLSLPLRTALSLLGRGQWPYRGVCFASTGKNEPPPAWVDELAPYLCVNFGEPRLTEQQRVTLEAVRLRPPSEEEWEALRELEPERIGRALRWASNPTPPAPLDSPEDSLLHWLIAFRSARADGGEELIRALRYDLAPHRLPPSIFAAAVRGLSPETTQFLAAAALGDGAAAASAHVVEELGQRGLLADEEVVPLKLWAAHAGGSAVAAEQGAMRFTREGISMSAARFVLDLPPDARTNSWHYTYDLSKAAALALHYGLPEPRAQIMHALLEAADSTSLYTLRELTNVYGGWAEALLGVTLEGRFPAAGVLTADEMAAAVQARSRALGRTQAPFEALAALAAASREDEAAALLQALPEPAPEGAAAAAFRVIKARLSLGPPAEPALSQFELEKLASLRLARPGDVTPGVGGGLSLAACARAWAETAPLARLLEGNFGAEAEPAPFYPEAWAEPLRRELTPASAAPWLRQLAPEQRPAALRWLAGLHGFDPTPLEAVCEGRDLPTGDLNLRALLPWLSAATSAASRERRLLGLANVAQSGRVCGDDLLAGQVADALLPASGGGTRAFVVYALSGVGPLPSLAGLPADLVGALAAVLDAVALVDAVFACFDGELSLSPELVARLAARVRESGAHCPAHGYTNEQRSRHLPLASALSLERGWEALAPDADGRALYVRRLLRQFRLEPDDPPAGASSTE